MQKSVGTQWANYQSDVISSGALGLSEGPDPGFDQESGDYKGFQLDLKNKKIINFNIYIVYNIIQDLIQYVVQNGNVIKLV